MNEIYPWLKPIWQHWQQLIQHHALPNAILCRASNGSGITTIVDKLAAAIVCQNSDDQACGFCHSCDLSSKGNHPDIHWLLPEKEGKGINVDQVREANRWAVESSQLGGRRVIVISPAEAMNESASNALLKTLETPPEKCIFVLLTTDHNALLPTILSRCQKWNIKPLPQIDLVNWLQLQPSLIDKQTAITNEQNNQYLKMYVDSPLRALEFLEQDKQSQYQSLQQLLISTVERNQIDIKSIQAIFKEDAQEKLLWGLHILSEAQKGHFGVLNVSASPNTIQLKAKLPYDLAYKQHQRLQKLYTDMRSNQSLNQDLLIINWFNGLLE